MRFRKKPVEIEAIQFDWNADNWKACCRFIDAEIPEDAENPPYLLIDTLEGQMMVNPGDWIIKGVAGEFYPCKPTIFEATYEKVDE